MSWVHKRVVPFVLKILLLFYIVAAPIADLVASQDYLQNQIPIFRQLPGNNDSPGDPESNAFKSHKYLSRDGQDIYQPRLIFKTYLHQADGLSIPASPAMFSQPDRGPPVVSPLRNKCVFL